VVENKIVEPAAAPAPTAVEEPAAPEQAAPPTTEPKPSAAQPVKSTPAPAPTAATSDKPSETLTVVAATPAPAPAAPIACGGDGQPDCPLEAFMEHEVDIPMEKGDLAKVAAAMTRTAGFVPDASWNAGAQGWATIANGAAAAAKAGDTATLQQSCKSCHKAWRKKYKETFRAQPLR
jgi:hypothetical protein